MSRARGTDSSPQAAARADRGDRPDLLSRIGDLKPDPSQGIGVTKLGPAAMDADGVGKLRPDCGEDACGSTG